MPRFFFSPFFQGIVISFVLNTLFIDEMLKFEYYFFNLFFVKTDS